AFRRSQQGAAEVRVAVMVAPAGVVRVIRCRRGDAVERAFEILNAAWLKFKSGHSQRRTESRYVDNSGTNTASTYGLAYLWSNIDDIAIAFCLYLTCMLLDCHEL